MLEVHLPGLVESSLLCPACDSEEFETRVERLEIPHFGEVIQMTYQCEGCGFRRSDLTITKQEEAARYRLEISEAEDLSTRVVRSASGHFEIPELDVRAEPGRAAEAFVTNVEGILDRCKSAIETALRGAETGQQRERAEELLERAERLRSLEETWSIVIEDPQGNSAILGDEADRTELTDEEAQALEVPGPPESEADDAVEP
jgi:zinc finger protein